MMISRTAEYALRAVLHLAAANGESVSQTVEQIAAGTRVPPDYLSKVLQNLSRAGLIASQRGIRGGFRLIRSASETSIYEVIQAVDPMQRIRECPLALEAHGTNLCPLHKRLDNAMELVENQFRATMIAELLEPTTQDNLMFAQSTLCAFPSESAVQPAPEPS